MIKDPVLGNITAHYLTPGETFHAQRGLMHWFVNPSPDTQWVTYQMWDTQAVTLQTFTHFIKAFSSIVPTANELVIGSNYTEPPDWPQPIRHYLGAALLEAGRAEEAEQVYLRDLRWNQNNGWSLYGLHQALLRQGKSADAEQVRAQYESAWRYAEVDLSRSRL